MYGNDTPTLKDLAVRILSQTASASACERNWSTFALVHTKQRNRVAYNRLEKLVFCSYNMRLQLRDKRNELEGNGIEDPLAWVEQSFNTVGTEEEDIFTQWIQPVHLDDQEGNPDPQVAAAARDEGIDVDRVMSDDVGSDRDTSAAPSSSYGGGGGGGGRMEGGGDHSMGDSAHGSYHDGGGHYEESWPRELGHPDLPTDEGPRDARASGLNERSLSMGHFHWRSSESASNDDALSQTMSSFGINDAGSHYGEVNSAFGFDSSTPNYH